MDYQLEVTAAARMDILEAIEYYTAGKSGLGSDFFAASQKTFHTLAAQPKLFQLIGKKAKVRKAKLPVFPYHVFFQVKERPKRVIVLAVLHEKRQPAVWKSRLD